MSEARARKRPAWWRHGIGLAITVACLVLVARRIDFDALGRAMADFRWGWLVPGIASLALGYALRILRWRGMLSASGAHVPYRRCVAPFLGAIAMNNVLPLRVGDVVRAFVFPASMGVPRTTAAGSLVIERLVVLATLVGALAFGLWAAPRIALPHALESTAVVGAIAAVAGLCAGFLFSAPLARWCEAVATRVRDPRVARVLSLGASLLHSFSAMSRGGALLRMLALSTLVWIFEAGLFWCALQGMQVAATPATALLVMAIATLSTLVPSSPGYFGPFHLAVFTTLTLLGASNAQAGSYAVIVHLALWVPTTLAGAIAIALTPALFAASRGAAPQPLVSNDP